MGFVRLYIIRGNSPADIRDAKHARHRAGAAMSAHDRIGGLAHKTLAIEFAAHLIAPQSAQAIPRPFVRPMRHVSGVYQHRERRGGEFAITAHGSTWVKRFLFLGAVLDLIALILTGLLIGLGHAQ